VTLWPLNHLETTSGAGNSARSRLSAGSRPPKEAAAAKIGRPTLRLRRKHSAFSFQPSAFSPDLPKTSVLSAFICVHLRPIWFFANSANALQSNQAAEIVAPREEFGV
jgi:hypothetical protein